MKYLIALAVIIFSSIAAGQSLQISIYAHDTLPSRIGEWFMLPRCMTVSVAGTENIHPKEPRIVFEVDDADTLDYIFTSTKNYCDQPRINLKRKKTYHFSELVNYLQLLFSSEEIIDTAEDIPRLQPGSHRLHVFLIDIVNGKMEILTDTTIHFITPDWKQEADLIPQRDWMQYIDSVNHEYDLAFTYKLLPKVIPTASMSKDLRSGKWYSRKMYDPNMPDGLPFGSTGIEWVEGFEFKNRSHKFSGIYYQEERAYLRLHEFDSLEYTALVFKQGKFPTKEIVRFLGKKHKINNSIPQSWTIKLFSWLFILHAEENSNIDSLFADQARMMIPCDSYDRKDKLILSVLPQGDAVRFLFTTYQDGNSSAEKIKTPEAFREGYLSMSKKDFIRLIKSIK